MSNACARKPIIFGNCKEVLLTMIMIYFAADLVFGEKAEESEFCKKGWSKFVNDREQWEKECLNGNSRSLSLCCNETADYLEYKYENYIKYCPIVGKFFVYDCWKINESLSKKDKLSRYSLTGRKK